MQLFILNIDKFSINDLNKILIPQEIIDKKNRFIRDYDKKISILSYLLKKYLFFKLKKNSNFKIIYNEYNKPYLIDNNLNKINFNISHHSKYIILVYDNNEEVGIDLLNSNEKCNLNLIKKIFHKREKDLLENIYDDNIKKKTFCRIWCFKEAFLKFIGSGIQSRNNLTINYLIPNMNNKLEIINEKIVLIRNSFEEKYTVNKCNIIELILDKINYICIIKEKEILTKNINITFIESISDLLL